jgi:hypothetical protein
MRKATQGFLILVGIACLAGVAVYQVAESWYNSRFVTNGEIRMVQPSGFLPSVDSQYAEHVNEPNSRANLNNGLGNAANAEATAIVADALVKTGEAHSKGFSEGAGLAVSILCFMFVLLSALAFLLWLGIWASKRK